MTEGYDYIKEPYDWIIHGEPHRIYKLLERGKVTPELLEVAYGKGMIRKEDLVHGQKYRGDCRNAGEATWDAGKNKFTYIRTKFGSSFLEDIVHPEDDEGYDIFVPVEVIQ